jgi:hypothetical protein
MYSGWTSAWPINRLLTQEEKDSALSRHRQEGIEPDDRGAATAFNSTYVEFVGRRFRLRGGISTLGISLSILFFMFLLLFLLIDSPLNLANIIGLSITAIFCLSFIFLFWFKILNRDYFTHTYYPIRFNRKTREIYVFRDARDGGIITVPWEEGFFHIGRGLGNKRLLDLRCHVMGSGEVVKDTFVTGMFYMNQSAVQQLWDFVRRYMDENIESLGQVEIWTTPIPSFSNCWQIAGTNIGAINNVLTFLLSPIIFALAGTRWLVMKTCKQPIFPAEIEAKCAIEPNDPHRLPEPQVIGQFTLERLKAKRLKAKRLNPE